MLRRNICLVVLFLLGVASSSIQAIAIERAGVANFEFLRDPAANFDVSTIAPYSISGGELTLVAAADHALPLWNDVGTFTATSLGSDRAGEIAAGDSNAAYGAEWDFLWNSAASITITAVPEPATGALLMLGALVLGGSRWRKKLN
jgi:hypothetical protein